MKWQEDVRNHRGKKKSLSFELQCLLYDGLQLFERATGVEHTTTGEDMMGKSVLMPLHADNIHLQHLLHPKRCPFGWSAPARPQLATLSASITPAQGDYQGSTARGLELEYHHCRWWHGRSKGCDRSSSGSLSLEVPTELRVVSDFLCAITHKIFSWSKLCRITPATSGCLILDMWQQAVVRA